MAIAVGISCSVTPDLPRTVQQSRVGSLASIVHVIVAAVCVSRRDVLLSLNPFWCKLTPQEINRYRVFR